MGSSDADTEAYENEKPQHTVTVSAFCISRYLATRQLGGKKWTPAIT
jgi:formylglycine-generating enzyme required for sulfatase activity